MAERTRLNVEVDQASGGVPLVRHLSKSASDLSSGCGDQDGRGDGGGADGGVEGRGTGGWGRQCRDGSISPRGRGSPPVPVASGRGATSVPQLSERVSVAQKTHSFFTTLKTRFGRSRSKERRAMRRKEAAAAAAAAAEGSLDRDNEPSGDREGDYGTEERSREGVRSERGARLRRDSTTDYAADNSSEHSSSATPLTQSPRHRLLSTHQDSKGSDPALARMPSGEASTGDSPRFRARSAVRLLLDSKRDSGGSSVLSAVASGIVSGSQAELPGPSDKSPVNNNFYCNENVAMILAPFFHYFFLKFVIKN